MIRSLCVAFLCVLAAGLLGGCVNPAALSKLDEKTAANSLALGESQKALASVQAELAAIRQSVAEREKAASARLDELAKSLEKAEANAVQANKQLLGFKENMATFDDQFKKMNSSIDQAQTLIIRNLENARDIYKTQFLALEEVLQNMKKAQKATEPKSPPAAGP